MNVKEQYHKQLNSPKWKAKRQIIFKRDDYKCTVCGSEKGIEVHHTYYYSNHPPPWKYPEESLLTLCNKCHYKWHLQHTNIIKHVFVKKCKKKIKKQTITKFKVGTTYKRITKKIGGITKTVLRKV